MRLLFGLSVIFLTTFLASTRVALCGDPDCEPDRLKRSLPSQERLEWLSLLHQNGGKATANDGKSIANYFALLGLIENAIDTEAQTLSGSSTSISPSPSAKGSETSANRSSEPGLGGASAANFDELKLLIQNTITPDGWIDTGGSASMREFRQGVRIDPKGLIERFDSTKAKLTSVRFDLELNKKAKSLAMATLSELGDWQEATNLRWVSLHQLDQQVAERLTDTKNTRANIAMELLGGLYRIDYLAYDQESREWFLGGPAGNLVASRSRELLNAETGLPPVLLEDLLGIAPHILRNKGEFGCSIDPDPIRLTEAYEMARKPSSMREMKREPEKWAEEWRQKLGRQQAKVIGLRQDSPTGYALLIADAHMKRLGLGLEPCPAKMKSYWHEKAALSSLGNSGDSGLVRWWFSLTDFKIPMDPERHVYHFASSNVQVLSEAQMMNAKGERVAMKSPDFAADAFAKKFTRNFEQLQRDYPVYGRLRHIFDLAVAMEIVRHEMRSGNGKPFLAIDNAQAQPRLPVAPVELESVASTYLQPNGSMSAMISGGVSIQSSDAISRLKVDKSETNKVAIESSNDSSKRADFAASHQSDLEGTLKPKRDLPFWK
jgi:Protein of unknown function (DUF1598)